MTNKLALYLGLTVVALLIVDAVFFGMSNSKFLARRFLELIEWLAFWR
ncbi:MAG: hypothetical protein AAGD04_10120 [Pseudomonadota bacterium]